MSAAELSALHAWAQLLQTVALSVIFIGAVIATYLTGDVLRRLGPDKGTLIPREGLALEAVPPNVELSDLRTGASATLHELRGTRVMLLFLSETCEPCDTLKPYLGWQAAKNKDTRFIAVVDEGTGENSLQTIDERVWIVEDRGHELAEAFEVRKMPFVYVIDRNGQVSMRAVTNTRLDLEDALDGAGHLQQTAWVPVEDGR